MFLYAMVSEKQIHVLDLDFVPFIDREQLQIRIQEIAAQISEDYREKAPVFVPILNGAFMFASDLFKEISIPCEVSFIKLASYTGTESTGVIKQVLGIQMDISGRHVVIVEDIVDTGLTMAEVIRIFSAMNPASLTVASLFVKPEAVQVELPIGYTGFEIDNKFILGYGLDYNGFGRNYPDVYVKVDE